MPLTNATIVIMALLTAGVVLSALRYGRIKRLTPSKKIMLIALRAAWVIALALSFLEPVIRFERFVPGRMRIPVLIDASVSMRNFSPEESVLPFLDSLNALSSRTSGRVSFEYFLFGDSTRGYKPKFPLSHSPARTGEQSGNISPNTVGAGLAPAHGLSFSDTKSLFPAAIDDGGAPFGSDMIIISDGHWTEARRSGSIFPRNTIHYLVLPEAAPFPFVTISCDAPETSPADSAFSIDANVNGFVHDSATLRVSLKEKNRVIKTETIEVSGGHFTHAVKFKTSNSRPGRKLYTVEASIDSAAAPAVSSFVHQTLPHFLTYSMYSASPTLDRRYMTQALASNKFFRHKAAQPDILFLFDWDSTAARLIKGLPRHAVTVFLGALPCSSKSIAAPAVTVKRNDNAAVNTSIDLKVLPPPQEIVACRQLPTSGTKRMLYAAVTSGGGTENVPILFSGRHRGAQGLFCPVKGIWRWDFWPMSSDRAESEQFGFSNLILSAARELLLDNISDQLILYPKAALHETDSARFFMSLPAAVPIFEPIKLSVNITGDGVNIDTTAEYRPTGLNRQPIAFPALPPGGYTISSKLTGQGVSAAFADSFTVNRDMSELSVMSQNTQYLQEFAHQLDTREPGDGRQSASDILEAWAQQSMERGTVTETIRIQRSWLLLGILLALLTIELILRRRWGVD